MIRACPRCRQTFDPARSGGLCPHCGHSSQLPRSAIALLGIAALSAIVVGAGILLGPLRPRDLAPPAPPAVPEIPDSEFPAAKASIRPPRDWRYLQRDNSSVAFTQVFGSAALRFRVTPPVSGRDAHLALVREIVPGAAVVEQTIPDWPGAEALAVRLAGDPRVGASWLLPRGTQSLHVIYWGTEAYLGDVRAFREGLRLQELTPEK